jgi:outer membrane protein OmpA-like peptidoglycan-associated protein
MYLKRILSLLTITISLPALVLLSGCTTNPYTGDQQASRTALGAGIGAGTGAVVGQLVGGNTAATLIGASIGTVVGGVAGNVMDRQAAVLRDQLRGTGVSVARQGNSIQLVMPGDITFATNSDSIKPNFYSVLNSVGLVLKEYKGTMIRVAGFTDNTGNPSYNQQLSERRAQSVATYLMSQGVDARRFAVLGFGARHPVASNAYSDGRTRNRRVEITLQPIQ